MEAPALRPSSLLRKINTILLRASVTDRRHSAFPLLVLSGAVPLFFSCQDDDQLDFAPFTLQIDADLYSNLLKRLRNSRVRIKRKLLTLLHSSPFRSRRPKKRNELSWSNILNERSCFDGNRRQKSDPFKRFRPLCFTDNHLLQRDVTFYAVSHLTGQVQLNFMRRGSVGRERDGEK